MTVDDCDFRTNNTYPPVWTLGESQSNLMSPYPPNKNLGSIFSSDWSFPDPCVKMSGCQQNLHLAQCLMTPFLLLITISHLPASARSVKEAICLLRQEIFMSLCAFAALHLILQSNQRFTVTAITLDRCCSIKAVESQASNARNNTTQQIDK